MKGNYKKQDSNTTLLTEILGSENQVSKRFAPPFKSSTRGSKCPFLPAPE